MGSIIGWTHSARGRKSGPQTTSGRMKTTSLSSPLLSGLLIALLAAGCATQSHRPADAGPSVNLSEFEGHWIEETPGRREFYIKREADHLRIDRGWEDRVLPPIVEPSGSHLEFSFNDAFITLAFDLRLSRDHRHLEGRTYTYQTEANIEVMRLRGFTSVNGCDDHSVYKKQ